MLTHTPHLPLILHYLDSSRDTSVEDEEAILLALQYPGRVRRIGPTMPAANLLKPVMVMDGSFSVLERLFIRPRSEANMSLMLPARSQAPHLCMFSLSLAVLPMRSPLPTNSASLVSLGLWEVPHSTTSAQIIWHHGLPPCPS
jgi:hypothetical protein